MSRVIENDHPWSEDEVRYQLSRGRHKLVEKNRRDFPPGSKPKPKSEPKHEELQLDPDIFEYVKSLNVEQLKAYLRELEIPPKGNEGQLKALLAQALQEERDAGQA